MNAAVKKEELNFSFRKDLNQLLVSSNESFSRHRSGLGNQLQKLHGSKNTLYEPPKKAF